MNPQLLSRADTQTLRDGLCPNCAKTRFLIGGIHHHQRGCYRKILCIHCLREFGVSPSTWRDGTVDTGWKGYWAAEPHAVILWFVLPAHRLASDYNIHTGKFPESKALGINPPALPENFRGIRPSLIPADA